MAVRKRQFVTPITARIGKTRHVARKVQTKEREMATFYFHCSGAQQVLVDRSGCEADDLLEARARAFAVIQTIIASEGPDDWRDWTVHVSDDEGDELLSVPFSSVLGRPH